MRMLSLKRAVYLVDCPSAIIISSLYRKVFFEFECYLRVRHERGLTAHIVIFSVMWKTGLKAHPMHNYTWNKLYKR